MSWAIMIGIVGVFLIIVAFRGNTGNLVAAFTGSESKAIPTHGLG